MFFNYETSKNLNLVLEEEELKNLMPKNKRIAQITEYGKFSATKMPKKMHDSFMKTAEIPLIYNKGFQIRGEFGQDLS